MPHTTETVFDRDNFARWYAKRHFETDPGVERIFYLPNNSPPREIRLLEINGMIPEMASPEPIDFGVDIGGSGGEGHTLYVLDLTPGQWDAIQRKQMELPNGWALEGKQEICSG
ncbi:MAG TPA: hypothetical protein VIK18_06860 [Pirellulales bacterium]